MNPTSTYAAIPQALPPQGYHFKDVQLEMSLKPFWDHTPATREAVLRELFLQWLPLCRFADTVSVMLWIGDGSEILEYEGDENKTFDWGRYHGCVNSIGHAAPPGTKDSGKKDHDAIGIDSKVRDSEGRGVHRRSYLYRDEPAVFTYKWLRGLIDDIHRIGKEVTGKPTLAGSTFDIGPEFAVSRFKYEWHPEICGGGALFGGKFVRCDALLHADQRTYAAFPQGFPEGTTVGTFLGGQCREFIRNHGFDFLWFSNGFGFALEPWALTGAIFDGARFHPEKARGTTESILGFWRDFRKQAPGVAIRTRGTNLGTGVDLGSDASPFREIYQENKDVRLPVNSPWAALDADLGLELAGWMSHIARSAGNGYTYRYYIHDAWWLNSPWLDRYQRQPFDIFLPLSVSRVTKDGTVEIPSNVAFLSADDSHGCLPPVVPTEVIAHLMHAREFAPDAPAPLVWIYPFDAYHDLAMNGRPDLPFFGDWFARGMIANGCPLNSVADLRDVREPVPGAMRGSLLVVPTFPGLDAKPFLDHADRGGKVLFYGPLEGCKDLQQALDVRCEKALDGDFKVEGRDRTIRHLSFLSAGGWSEVAARPVLSALHADGTKRSVSTLRSTDKGGQLAWVRGSLSTAEYDPEHPAPIKGPRLVEMDPLRFLSSEQAARELLAKMGLSILFENSETHLTPTVTIHRHRNAFVFSGYQPGVPVRLGVEAGAPLFPGHRNLVEGGLLEYAGPPSWHHVSRAFVQQEKRGHVTCRILPPIQHGYTLRILVAGLQDATVRFFPEPGTEDRLEILLDPYFPYFKGNFVKPGLVESAQGRHICLTGVTGEVLFSW